MTMLSGTQLPNSKRNTQEYNMGYRQYFNEINTYYNSNGGGYYLAEDTIEDIDNLVKEMAGNAE